MNDPVFISRLSEDQQASLAAADGPLAGIPTDVLDKLLLGES